MSGRRGLFLPLMGLLVATMWVALFLWEQSPYGRYLAHGDWTQLGLAGSICRALPAGAVLLPGLIYVGGWVLMVAAMMLPTVFPLLEIFRRLTRRRGDRHLLLALVIAGYLAAWLAFGIAAHLLDGAVVALVQRSLWLSLNPWLLAAAILLLAAAYQVSPLKYRCLDRCRSPLGFIIARWRGGAARLQSLLLGLQHGAFCVGCCWALMLLMFVVGTGNVGIMLALGAVMAAEKNLPWGRRLSAPLGLALAAWALVLVAQHGTA